VHERVFKRSALLAASVMAVVVQAWAQAPPSSTTPAALAVNGDVGTTLSLSPAQRADLVAFLQSLTDLPLLEDPQLGNPWPTSRTPGGK
jgi:hypothetical protein